MDFSTVEEGMRIKFIGGGMAYGGYYKTYTTESTYKNIEDCPEGEVGKLLIIELMNDGTPMFFPLYTLNKYDWELAK